MKSKEKNFKSSKYINSAIVQKEIVSRLIERLSFINISPRKVLDVGSGVGLGTSNLIKLYSKTDFFMLDICFSSLRNHVANSKDIFSVCANFKSIPFNEDTFDFVFSSSALHWDLDIYASFKEIYRVLKPGGLFLFSTYGPDTLIELRSAWHNVDNRKHVNDFYDMHDIGDLMLNLNFIDTVVDTEKIIIEYENVTKLQKDLKNIGSKVLEEPKKSVGLQGIRKMKLMYAEYEKFRMKSGGLPATYEVIYGSAWKKMDNIIKYTK